MLKNERKSVYPKRIETKEVTFYEISAEQSLGSEVTSAQASSGGET